MEQSLWPVLNNWEIVTMRDSRSHFSNQSAIQSTGNRCKISLSLSLFTPKTVQILEIEYEKYKMWETQFLCLTPGLLSCQKSIIRNSHIIDMQSHPTHPNTTIGWKDVCSNHLMHNPQQFYAPYGFIFTYQQQKTPAMNGTFLRETKIHQNNRAHGL